MKIYISADFEGATGITSRHQIRFGNPEFERYRSVWVKDLNSLIQGAFDGGAEQVVVNEAHSGMNYILPDLIHPSAEYISGYLKPFSQMEGLDKSFDLVFLFTHARAGTYGVLSHSFVFFDVYDMKLNNIPIGELGLNAGWAGFLNVPVGLVIGDDKAAQEAKELMPDVSTAITKTHISQFTAKCLSASRSQDYLQKTAAQAVRDKNNYKPLKFGAHFELEITFSIPAMAEIVAYIPGVERKNERTIVYKTTDYEELIKIRILATNLAKSIGDQAK